MAAVLIHEDSGGGVKISRLLILSECHPCFICVKLSPSELLHAHSDERPSVDASHAARGIGIPVQSETVHAFFCAEKQSQCGGLRKRAKGACARQGCRRV